MELFKEIYTFPEKNLFNSLTKKTGRQRPVPADVPLVSHDEIRTLSGNYNLLLAEMRDILYNTKQMSLRITLGCSKVKKQVNGSPVNARLQTCTRDTGEILNDLSHPIYINRRHWGAFIVGLKPDQLCSN